MIEPKKSLQNLEPYLNGNHSAWMNDNHRRTLKLDSNESSVGPAPAVVAALIEYLKEGPLHYYPDVSAERLHQALSKYTGLPTEFVLSFNGSDHALETIAHCYLNSNDAVLQFSPTYDQFRICVTSCDAKIISCLNPKAKNLSDDIQKNKNEHTKIIYLVNPNNPTGDLFKPESLLPALKQHSELLFIVDEAYFEFSQTTAANLTRDFTNLIVTRSFSKAFGMAGLRCGYVLAHPEIIQNLAKIRIGKNLNSLTQIAATAALEHLEHMERYVFDVSQTKEWLITKMQSLGVPCENTAANFVLLTVAEPQKICEELEKELIFVRDRSQLPQMPGQIRLTVGDSLIMQRFFKVFEKLPAELLFRKQSTIPQDSEKLLS